MADTQAPKQTGKYLRNNTPAARTITWGDGKHAFKITPNQSLPVEELPEGFLDLDEVKSLIELGILETHQA